ncbi:60S acidic ribosomal protein P1 [Balamuthia mandrillaris]
MCAAAQVARHDELMRKYGRRAVCSINELSPVLHDVVVIGVVERRGQLREWNDKKREQVKSVYSFVLRDSTDTIQVTCWKDASHYYEMLNVGDTVEVDGASIKPKSVNYGMGCTSDLELHVDRRTASIRKHTGDFQVNMRQPLRTNFVELKDVGHFISGSVNLLTVVGKVEPANSFISKAGKRCLKQSIYLFDKTCEFFCLTVWGAEGISSVANLARGDVVFWQNVVIDTYQEKLSASFSFQSSVIEDPDIREAHMLKAWARANMHTFKDLSFSSQRSSSSSSQRKQISIDEIHDYYNCSQILGMEEECAGFTFVTVTKVHLENAVYLSCPTCHRKVGEEMRCTGLTCRKPDEQPVYSFKVGIEAIDYSASVNHLLLFGDVAEQFLGVTASDFIQYSPEQKQELATRKVWNRYKVYFRIPQSRGDQDSKRPSVLACRPADPKEIASVLASIA